MKTLQRYSGIILPILLVAALALWPTITGKAANRERTSAVFNGARFTSCANGKCVKSTVGRAWSSDGSVRSIQARVASLMRVSRNRFPSVESRPMNCHPSCAKV